MVLHQLQQWAPPPIVPRTPLPRGVPQRMAAQPRMVAIRTDEFRMGNKLVKMLKNEIFFRFHRIMIQKFVNWIKMSNLAKITDLFGGKRHFYSLGQHFFITQLFHFFCWNFIQSIRIQFLVFSRLLKQNIPSISKKFEHFKYR